MLYVAAGESSTNGPEVSTEKKRVSVKKGHGETRGESRTTRRQYVPVIIVPESDRVPVGAAVDWNAKSG
jgi:hypothetical protein